MQKKDKIFYWVWKEYVDGDEKKTTNSRSAEESSSRKYSQWAEIFQTTAAYGFFNHQIIVNKSKTQKWPKIHVAP